MPKRAYVQKNELRNRLAKIQGQLSGLQRMLDEGRSAEESLVQISALRAALDQYGARLTAKRLCEPEFSNDNSFEGKLALIRQLLR